MATTLEEANKQICRLVSGNSIESDFICIHMDEMLRLLNENKELREELHGLDSQMIYRYYDFTNASVKLVKYLRSIKHLHISEWENKRTVVNLHGTEILPTGNYSIHVFTTRKLDLTVPKTLCQKIQLVEGHTSITFLRKGARWTEIIRRY